MGARRYNKGKLRYELIPTFAKKQIAEVYTRGAHKYSIYEDDKGNKIKGVDIKFEERDQYNLIDDASDNWRKGLPWMESMGSIERHLESWKNKEDFDKELNTYHLANAAWGMLTLLESYILHPELDDRINNPSKRISLDVDDVCADFLGEFCKYHNLGTPTCWNFNDIPGLFRKMELEGINLNNWFENLPSLLDPSQLTFTPVAYITARTNVETSVTYNWLLKNGFPMAPIYTNAGDKIQACKDAKVDIHIDDSYEIYKTLNAAGICCFLYDQPHNRMHDVGYRRIYNLKDFLKT